MRPSLRVLAWLGLLLVVGGTAQAEGLEVHDAWVRLPPPGTNTAGYLELRNTADESVRIVGVESAAAQRVEMHRTAVKDGVARMRPVDAIEVPAGGRVALEPGGLHLMLIGPRGLREGEPVSLTFTLASGETVVATADVRRGHGGAKGHDSHHSHH